jgi:hypothetical protein
MSAPSSVSSRFAGAQSGTVNGIFVRVPGSHPTGSESVVAPTKDYVSSVVA